MMKGFKDFITRGNVIDLATAVVIGAAFTGLVTSFTDNVVQPLVDRVGAGGDREYGILKIPLGGDQFIDLNAVLSSAINFLIVAAVVYFVIIVPYKKMKERDPKVEEAETELTLLTQIRDLLSENGEGSGRHGATPAALDAEAAEARKSDSS
jgi:large conductance mechanosensitive channel